MPKIAANFNRHPGIQDMGLAASVKAKTRLPFKLEEKNGTFLFIFDLPTEELERLQREYFSGELRLAASDVISCFKLLKDSVFAAKRSSMNRPTFRDVIQTSTRRGDNHERA